MSESTTQMLTRMTAVKEVKSEETANRLLSEGWRLLAVEQVPMHEGGDSWIQTKYVFGYPNQYPLSDAEG
ncbi:hypothetical protein FEO91_08750 [Stenotrophomonas maltophilia]|nr:hypothetical protein FEO91_08750 [Stenotrophomonas maltophilia]